MEAGSRKATEAAYRDLKATGPDWGPATLEVTAELDRARLWLDAHHHEQEKLFQSLRQAVQAGDTKTVCTPSPIPRPGTG